MTMEANLYVVQRVVIGRFKSIEESAQWTTLNWSWQKYSLNMSTFIISSCTTPRFPINADVKMTTQEGKLVSVRRHDQRQSFRFSIGFRGLLPYTYYVTLRGGVTFALYSTWGIGQGVSRGGQKVAYLALPNLILYDVTPSHKIRFTNGHVKGQQIMIDPVCL